jgi:hypothetical protein
VESQIGIFRKASLRKKDSAPPTMNPITANASVKKLSRLVAKTSLSTSTILYRKIRLNITQMTAIFRTI